MGSVPDPEVVAVVAAPTTSPVSGSIAVGASPGAAGPPAPPVSVPPAGGGPSPPGFPPAPAPAASPEPPPPSSVLGWLVPVSVPQGPSPVLSHDAGCGALSASTLCPRFFPSNVGLLHER